LGINNTGNSQDSTIFSTWKFAGVQYQVPANWEGDPFGSYKPDEWNDYGSAVCKCTGIIHIDYDTDLKMVFYPSLIEDLESERHNMIWDYIYKRVQENEILKVGKATFYKEVSKFENTDKYVVWRYKTIVGKYGYLIYFFASPDVIEQNAHMIHAIVQSFRKSNSFQLKIK
jgi:hypothetical protein